MMSFSQFFDLVPRFCHFSQNAFLNIHLVPLLQFRFNIELHFPFPHFFSQMRAVPRQATLLLGSPPPFPGLVFRLQCILGLGFFSPILRSALPIDSPITSPGCLSNLWVPGFFPFDCYHLLEKPSLARTDWGPILWSL